MIEYGYWFYKELAHRVGKHKPRLVLTTPNKDAYSVRASSTRLELLARSPKCVRCRIEGVLWILQAQDEKTIPHLDLFAIRGNNFILMTQDHITPKSRGGRDHMSNLQVMCAPCNEWKADRCPNMIKSLQQSGTFTNDALRLGLTTLML